MHQVTGDAKAVRLHDYEDSEKAIDVKGAYLNKYFLVPLDWVLIYAMT